VLAFSGTYKVKSVVTATTGTYGESVGAIHRYRDGDPLEERRSWLLGRFSSGVPVIGTAGRTR
jgi:hypothetical protein